MGKTVGLMSTAYWLRQQVNIPVLWFRSEGDLEQFFHRLHDNDFDNGAFIFVDDMAIYNADLDDIPLEILRKFCFIATSRETRWLRYGSRIKARFDRVIEEQIRQLNKNDATEIRDKIAQYGTLIYFKSGTRENQIAEVLEFSGRDLLVLIRELGQGLKFEAILQSEVDELSDEQRFCYFLICIADRVQVPLPRDLLRRAVLEEYPSVEFIDLVTGLGRLVRYSSGSTAVRSRHSVIAARVVEDPKRRDSALRRKAVEAYYKAFSHYQIPIIVHHSNTAHARVFKAVVYNRFLVQIFGNDEAIKIYHAYEKAFEKDAFYWQQFGLCYLRAKQHKLAVETLTHAATLHDNPLIKHSLGIAKLTTCFDLGPAGLGRLEFDQIRAEGKNELEVLHARNGAREDIAIVSLADLDIKIGRRFDPAEKSSEIEREYHTKLAFYLRSNPNMGGARRIYDQLHGALIGGSDYVGLSAEDVIESDI
jgi:tetratricopeptide (TPR) repeat protein